MQSDLLKSNFSSRGGYYIQVCQKESFPWVSLAPVDANDLSAI